MLRGRCQAVPDGLRNERLDYEDIAGLMGQIGSGVRTIAQLLSICEWPARILRWNLGSMKICKS